MVASKNDELWNTPAASSEPKAIYPPAMQTEAAKQPYYSIVKKLISVAWFTPEHGRLLQTCFNSLTIFKQKPLRFMGISYFCTVQRLRAIYI